MSFYLQQLFFGKESQHITRNGIENILIFNEGPLRSLRCYLARASTAYIWNFMRKIREFD